MVWGLESGVKSVSVFWGGEFGGIGSFSKDQLSFTIVKNGLIVFEEGKILNVRFLGDLMGVRNGLELFGEEGFILELVIWDDVGLA